MGIGEAIKKGFVETSKLLKIVLIFFVFNAMIGLLSLPLTDPANSGNASIVAMSAVSSIVFFLIFVFLQGGALGLINDHIKTGTVNYSNFNEYGKKFYVRILGLLLVYILLAISVVLLLALISAGVLLLGDNVVTRSIVAVIVSLVSVGVITALIFPVYVIVIEDAGPIQALKKGVMTAKNNFLKTLGLFLVLLLASLLISLIVGFIAGLITIPLGDGGSRVVLSIVNSAIQSYIPVVMMLAFMGFYTSMGSGSSSGQPTTSV